MKGQFVVTQTIRQTEIPTLINNIHIRTLMNNLIDNTNKYTNITTCTFTYNPLLLRHVSFFLDDPQGIVHQNSISKEHR